jgi:hypothetical protein
MSIIGYSFGTDAPVVKLGNLALTVTSNTPTEILATVPPGVMPGTYLLSVQTQNETAMLPCPAPARAPPWSEDELDQEELELDDDRDLAYVVDLEWDEAIG